MGIIVLDIGGSRAMSEGGGRLSDRDAAVVVGQVAGLAGAGLPLGPGLRALGEEMPTGRLRRALRDLARALDAGEPLEAALAGPGSGMPAHLRGLVRAGARTGRVGQVLGRFAGYADVGVDLRRELGLRLAYPIATVVLAVALFVAICATVLASFEAMFQDFGMPLPPVTLFLFSISHAVTVAWRPTMEGIAVVGALVVAGGLAAGRPTRNAVASYIPVIGPVLRWTALAEFCHLLGLLLESDLPMSEAVAMTGDGVQDAEIRSACRAMSAAVARGGSLASAMEGRGVFPGGTARIVAWAEGHRGLPEALHMLGAMFEARARAQASFAGTVVGFLAIFAVMGGIVTTVGAVMIPMITLITRLSG